MATIDFRSATAEAVKERVELLAQYEIYPTGTFDEKLTEVLNQKLRQPPPETHKPMGEAVTKEQFNKMSYQEQISLKKDNPDLYKTFIK